LPRPWNNGVVEYWNVGFKKDVIRFKFYRQTIFAIDSTSHFHWTLYSIFPVKVGWVERFLMLGFAFLPFGRLFREFAIWNLSETQQNRSLNPTYKFYDDI
jgi:hypothetical protein